MSAERKPRVAVLYNAPILPAGHPDAVAEADVVDVAWAVSQALSEHGFEVEQVAARPPIDDVLSAIRAAAPDVVFNLIEGFGGSSVGANLVTALLELTGLAFTGCPSEALTWCLSKGRAKTILRGEGLATAPFVSVGTGDPIPEWAGPWPVVVKPDAEDASLGIDQRSVARDHAAMTEQLAHIRANYGRALIEAYLPGPEFNVGLLALPDPLPLPVAEVLFAPSEGDWPILTYASKWVTGSSDDLASPIRCPAQIDPDLSRLLGDLSVAAFRATGCRDYARVDFRLDARGEPMILEVNPNPDIGPTAGWARALKTSGRDYAATISALVQTALSRVTR